MKQYRYYSLFDDFKKYRVEAANVADFLARYYKRSRYTGRGAEYAALLLSSYEDELKEKGFCFISNNDSTTGEITAYYAPPAQSAPLDDLPLFSGLTAGETL